MKRLLCLFLIPTLVSAQPILNLTNDTVWVRTPTNSMEAVNQGYVIGIMTGGIVEVVDEVVDTNYFRNFYNQTNVPANFTDTALGLQVVTNVVTNLVVTGTLTPDVTGVYVPNGTYGPKPYYEQVSKGTEIRWQNAQEFWFLATVGQGHVWGKNGGDAPGSYDPAFSATGTATVVYQVLTNYTLAYASLTPGVLTGLVQNGSAVPVTNLIGYLAGGSTVNTNVYSSCLSNSVSGGNNICITTNAQEIVLTGATTCYWPSGDPQFIGTIYQQWIVGTNNWTITGDVSFASNFALTNSGNTATMALKQYGSTTWHMMVIP